MRYVLKIDIALRRQISKDNINIHFEISENLLKIYIYM